MRAEIIGRDAELSVVQAFLDRPADGVRALILEGEAGVGKSTLWQAGVAAARERSFRVLTSRPAEAERTLAYVVLGDLFADADPQVLAALSAPRRRAFDAALLQEEPDLAVDPRALGVAILTLLPMLADRGPLVLAIDDLQWMDTSSAATLRFALRRLLRQPILLLLSRRFHAEPSTPLEETLDTAEVDRLRIGPLSMGAIELMLRRRLGIAFPRPTLLRLHEASGGNPFYALELARARSADPTRDPTERFEVPPSLERLVVDRLEVLDVAARRTLLLVAAHGRLPVALLRALDIAPEGLDQARAANVIDIADGVIAFTHPLLASAVYQAAAVAERHAAHRFLATVLVDPVDRGRHLALAADEPDHDLAAALESAASTARDRGMPMAAAELAEHGLRLTPLDAVDDRDRRAIAVARMHFEAGDGSRTRSIVAGLLAVAEPGPRRAEALILRSELDDPGSALAFLHQALVEAAEVPALKAAIHAGLARAGRFTEGRAWAERHARASLRLADRLNDDGLRANALSMLAPLRFDRGDPHALELAEKAYRLATPLADPRPLKQAGLSVTHVISSSELTDRAREWLELQLTVWRDRDEQVRSDLLSSLALVELRSGRWTIASEYADQAREIRAPYGLELPQHHLVPALIALHRGQFAVARSHSRRALSLAKGQLLPVHHGVLAMCDLWSGNPAAAVANFIRAEQTADSRGWDEPIRRGWRAEYVEALLMLGRVNDAVRLIADWEAAAERLGRERVLAHVLRCRGLVAAARGNLPAALDLLDEAADRHEAVGDPFGRARALLALGVVRRRARQKRNARTALEAALAGFEALGAASWATAARAERARIGGRERIEGLSPSELPVAKLVADGLTNREIASALFLSETTVASHLSHIYAKLGVRSRTELMRQMLPEGQLPSEDASKVHTS